MSRIRESSRMSTGGRARGRASASRSSTSSSRDSALSTAAVTQFGGHDYDFVDKVPDECPCLVCSFVQKDPYQVTCCGKIFCKSCLDQLMKDKHHCPNCRANLYKEKKFFPDINTDRKIKHLRIYCINKKDGCRWTGFLKDLNSTHIPKCRIQRLACPNKRSDEESVMFSNGRRECGLMIRKNEFDKHVKQECGWREVSCTHCKAKGTHHFITGQHTHACPEVFVNCDNTGCDKSVRRKHLQEHQSTCPKQVLSCLFTSVGCTTRVAREKMAEHNESFMASHLEKMVSKVKSVCEETERVRMEVDELRRSRTCYCCHEEPPTDDDDDSYTYW